MLLYPLTLNWSRFRTWETTQNFVNIELSIQKPNRFRFSAILLSLKSWTFNHPGKITHFKHIDYIEHEQFIVLITEISARNRFSLINWGKPSLKRLYKVLAIQTWNRKTNSLYLQPYVCIHLAIKVQGRTWNKIFFSDFITFWI